MLGFTAAENNYFFGGQEPRDFAWERVRFINPQPRITAIFVLLVLSWFATTFFLLLHDPDGLTVRQHSTLYPLRPRLHRSLAP